MDEETELSHGKFSDLSWERTLRGHRNGSMARRTGGCILPLGPHELVKNNVCICLYVSVLVRVCVCVWVLACAFNWGKTGGNKSRGKG